MDRPTRTQAAPPAPPGAPLLLEATRRLGPPFTRPDGAVAFEPMPGGSVPLYTIEGWAVVGDLMEHALAHGYFHRERPLDRLAPPCKDQSQAEWTSYVLGPDACEIRTT